LSIARASSELPSFSNARMAADVSPKRSYWLIGNFASIRAIEISNPMMNGCLRLLPVSPVQTLSKRSVDPSRPHPTRFEPSRAYGHRLPRTPTDRDNGPRRSSRSVPCHLGIPTRGHLTTWTGEDGEHAWVSAERLVMRLGPCHVTDEGAISTSGCVMNQRKMACSQAVCIPANNGR
jgi:hypothetical protein